jgi:hypothetical protein
MARGKFSGMKSMEMGDEEKLDFDARIAPQPDFPYGLRISLTEKEFEKLDLDHTVAEVGGMVHGHFMGRITHASHDKHESGVSCRVEIQIEDLEIESEDEEN